MQRNIRRSESENGEKLAMAENVSGWRLKISTENQSVASA
jgi:hypothetical protein